MKNRDYTETEELLTKKAKRLEKDINYSRHTIIDCMNELEEFGLICKLQEKGKPSRIYVKNFNRRCRFQLIG